MVKLKNRIVAFYTFSLASILAPYQVCAQDVEASASPSVVDQPQYEIDAGISIAERYSDNIFYTANDKRSDWATIISPWVSMSWKQEDFRLNLEASSEIARFSDYSSEDYEDYYLGAEARYRINESIFTFGGLDYSKDHESRFSPEAVNGLTPTEFVETSGFFGLGGSLDTGDFRIGVNVRDFDFENTPTATGIINNDDRNRRQTEIGGRFGLARVQGGEVFVQTIYDNREYDLSTDDFGYQRSSEGIEAAVGFKGSIGRAEGEALVGVMSRDYDDARFATTTELDLGVDLTWALDRQTSLDATLERSIEESTLAGASGYVSTSAGLRLRHRVADNLSLAGYAFVTQNDYQGLMRTDTVSEFGVSLRHYFNQRLYMDLDYDFRQRNSNTAGEDFDENRITLSFGAALQERYNPATNNLARANSSGFYLGGFFGNNALQTRVDGPRGSTSLTADFGDQGPAAGIFAGYRWDYNSMVLGVEAEAEFNETSWSHLANRTFSVERGNAYSLSGVAGLRTKQGNILYSRFGVISAEFNTKYQELGGPLVAKSGSEQGLLVGVGAELPMGNGLSGRVEYQLRSYNDYDIGPNTSGNDDDNFSNVESAVRFGLVYQLGGNASAPKPSAATDFSGAYAGVFGAHGTLQSDNSGPRDGGGNPFVLDVTRSGQGLAGGLVAGYGVQSNRFYFGVEAELELSNTGWNIERDSRHGRVYSIEKTSSVGAALRIGYVVNDGLLLYGRAGVVQSNFDMNYTIGSSNFSQSTNLDGVRLGAGVEFAVNNRTHANLEFVQTDYGSNSIDYDTGVDQFNTTERLFRVLVTRRF